MSQQESSEISRLLSLAGIVGAILVFAVVLYVAYLPGRPPAVDSKVAEERKQAADEARAAGLAKISTLEVMDAEAGIVRIPIADAIELTVEDYQAAESSKD